MRVLCLLSIGLLLAVEQADGSGRAVCYYATWAYGYTGPGKFLPSNIDPTLCTHLIYSFVGIGAEGEVLLLDPDFDIAQNGLKDFAALKDESSVKTLLAVGGWNVGSTNFSIVSANATLRSNFANNVLAFLKEHNLCGCDLDWEYPSQRENSTAADKENFVLLVQALRAAFDNSAQGYLLSAAVSATQSGIDLSYNVTALSPLLDFINLMTYDMHGTWDGVTGANAPLYPQPTDAAGTVLTVNASVHAWISSGADPSKLNLGLGNYGQAYTLADASNNGTGAPIVAATAANAAPYTGVTSTWNYNEICADQVNNTALWSIVNANNSYVYATKDTLWVGYDDPDTMRAKGKYAKDTGLGGVMFWALHGDDFLGYCGKKYALAKAAVKGYKGSGSRKRRHLERTDDVQGIDEVAGRNSGCKCSHECA